MLFPFSHAMIILHFLTFIPLDFQSLIYANHNLNYLQITFFLQQLSFFRAFFFSFIRFIISQLRDPDLYNFFHEVSSTIQHAFSFPT